VQKRKWRFWHILIFAFSLFWASMWPAIDRVLIVWYQCAWNESDHTWRKIAALVWSPVRFIYLSWLTASYFCYQTFHISMYVQASFYKKLHRFATPIVSRTYTPLSISTISLILQLHSSYSFIAGVASYRGYTNTMITVTPSHNKKVVVVYRNFTSHIC
jgi:hypothetical protein